MPGNIQLVPETTCKSLTRREATQSSVAHDLRPYTGMYQNGIFLDFVSCSKTQCGIE